MVASEPLWIAVRVPDFAPNCSQYVCLHSNMLAIAILSRALKEVSWKVTLQAQR